MSSRGDHRTFHRGRYVVYVFSHFFIAKTKGKGYQVYTKYRHKRAPKILYDKGIVVSYPQDYFGEYEKLEEAMTLVRGIEATIRNGRVRKVPVGTKGTAAMFEYPETGARIYRYPEKYPEEAVHEWAHGRLSQQRRVYEEGEKGLTDEERDAAHMATLALRRAKRWDYKTRRNTITALATYIGRREAEELVFQWEREPIKGVPKLAKWTEDVLEESKT